MSTIQLSTLRNNIRQLKSECLAPAIAVEQLGKLVNTFLQDRFLSQLIQSKVSQGLYQRYRLSHLSDDFQIVLVMWEPGKESPIHDHHETIGVVANVLGETIETRYQQMHRIGKYCELKLSARYPLKPSIVSPILPGKVMQLHQMTNPSRQWAATLHVYLDCLETFHLYRPILKPWYVAIPKTLWFDDIKKTQSTQEERPMQLEIK